MLTIPEDDLDKRHGGLLNILSIHGEDKHAVVFYLDKQFRPRSTVHLDELPEIDRSRVIKEPAIPAPSDDDSELFELLIDRFGTKRKKAIENFSKIAVQIMTQRNVYLVTYLDSSGLDLIEKFQLIFEKQGKDPIMIGPGESHKVTGLNHSVFDLKKKKFLIEGSSVDSRYFRQLVNDVMGVPNSHFQLKTELSKILFSYNSLRKQLNELEDRILDTDLARKISIDLFLIPVLLEMARSEGINVDKKIEFDGLGHAIRSF
jgi:hypothetical protein